MGRLVIVSNRLPVSVEKRKEKLHFARSIGGLATALGSFYKSQPSLWIGWPGIELEKIKGQERDIIAGLQPENCYPVFLRKEDVDDFYHGFCNITLWPLFHYFPQYAVYKEELWQAYHRVNEAFANVVAEAAEDGDVIWIQDYHFMLLPKLIRDRLPKAAVGFFLHIPFPSFEIFRLLPWRSQILEGLLGADLVGFHTYDYTWHFINSVRNLLGYQVAMGQITTPDRIIKADVFPIGIDYENYANAAQNSEVQAEVSKFREKIGDRKIILSVDRLDYSKGIPNRLEGFSLFLEKHPEYREKIIFILVVGPSRITVEHYAQLKKRMEELVGEINGKHGIIGWMPIWYLHTPLSFRSVIALYNMADVCLVTPLRDGMNLVAKEYLSTKTDGKGVLILSETAGAAKELGEAVSINVNNVEEIAEALAAALAMPEEEQRERNRAMQQRIRLYSVGRWADDFINSLLNTRKIQDELGAKKLDAESGNKIVSDYQKSQRRLILLDYDGTLVPFASTPEEARPDSELIELLNKFSRNTNNRVVLISGRNRSNLEKWFGGLDIALVAEHGAWVKEKGKDWEMIETLTSGWKNEIRPILELSMDRIPGTFIEEKDFSLAWHYRQADPKISSLRAREIVNDLLNVTANYNLHVLEGSKVVEVKDARVTKGRAALRWISQQTWDFILAIGDDSTDEDMFKVLPATAWSIKVRFGMSVAKFTLDSPSEVRSLLKEMIGKS